MSKTTKFGKKTQGILGVNTQLIAHIRDVLIPYKLSTIIQL
jgi:hypothetical protein